MQPGDIAMVVYLTITAVVAVAWSIYRERPNGSYLIPEEGVFMSAVFIGMLWPFEIVGILFIIALLFWHRETKWQKP